MDHLTRGESDSLTPGPRSRSDAENGASTASPSVEVAKTNEVSLRDVREEDLAIFFDQQLDPDATRMAAFPPRDGAAFMAHWRRSMAHVTAVLKTVVFRGMVAGNIVYWERDGQPNVGFWLGKEYWGRGIASAALLQFLAQVSVRPLYARVAKHNAASRRVLEKCGFLFFREGVIKAVDGTPCVEDIMRLGERPSHSVG